jgi:AhpC/TSA family
VWQELYEELKGRGFMVIAVALDSRAGDAEKWIEAARPSYVCLIDRDHRLAELYHMVNVPQAVWIDERGRIVRPTESAGAYEGFRKMDRATRQMPEDVARVTADAKATYANAIRDWVLNGPASKHVFDPEGARARVTVPTERVARAHAAFRLGQYLIRKGHAEEGDRWLAEASELHPESWAIWRQRAEVNELGLASSPAFWERVDALGQRRYYAPVDMEGMPG